MIPPSILALYEAEVRKLLSRTSARVGLVLALLLGLGVPILRGLWQVGMVYVASQNGADASQIPAVDPTGPVYFTLWLRNFFLLRVFLIMIGALSFAGEYQTRTLREDLLRPVSRPAILLTKWLALVTWIAATMVLSGGTASLVSLIAFPGGEGWGTLALQYLVAILCDAGFAAVVLLVAVLIRSVAGTLAGMFLFYLADLATAVGLMLMASVPMFGLDKSAQELAAQVSPWLPSAAFAAWNGGTIWASAGTWSAPAFASLGVLTFGSLLLAIWQFNRLDVP